MDALTNIFKKNKNVKVKITTGNLYNIEEVDTHVQLGWKKTFTMLAFYIAIFAILIPLLLVKEKYYDFLESYFPNLDLIANLLSFEGGIFPGYLFLNLYQSSPISLPAFLSQVTINYLALIGVTFVIARETKLTKSIAKGWSLGFIMLLMTYLLPSQFISSAMSDIHQRLMEYFNTTKQEFSTYFISVCIGAIMTISVILLEKEVIQYLRNYLNSTAEFIIKVPTLIK